MSTGFDCAMCVFSDAAKRKRAATAAAAAAEKAAAAGADDIDPLLVLDDGEEGEVECAVCRSPMSEELQVRQSGVGV